MPKYISDRKRNLNLGINNHTEGSDVLSITGNTRLSGIITAITGVAVTYFGDGSNLTGIDLGVGINTVGGNVGYGITLLDFRGAGVSTITSPVSGISTINITGGGGGASVSIGTEAPSSPSAGDLWYNNDKARTFIYYDEVDAGIGTNKFWVDSSPFVLPATDTPVAAKTSATFTALNNQKAFTFAHNVGFIDVYLNGVRLSESEFVSDGASVTLDIGASAGDIVDLVQYRMGIGATGPQGPAGGKWANFSTNTGITTTLKVQIQSNLEVTGVTTSTGGFVGVLTGNVTGNVTGNLTGTASTATAAGVAYGLTGVPNVTVGILTATDVNSTSDLKLKKNILVIDNAVNKIKSITGVTFQWKENEEMSAGVIAQDVEMHLPELVKECSGAKTVNYNGLVGVLIEVVKEQQNQLDELKARISKLEG